MRRAAGALALLALLGACEHAQPFGAADLGPNGPFSSGSPLQLTFSPLPDAGPVWLPGGAGIMYSLQLAQPDHSRCLGVLPAGGGRLVETVCHALAPGVDLTVALTAPAVGPGGLLAYLREESNVGSLAPSSRELVVASVTAPDSGRAVLRLPYTAPDGVLHGTLSHLAWLDQQTLVYLAESVTYFSNPFDTAFAPIEIVVASLSGDSATVRVLPGTAGATSVTPAGAGTVYFTLQGDSIVYAMDVATGTRSVVFDFGAVGPVTDVQVAGSRLMVVGGGFARGGLAGQLYVVDLGAGGGGGTVRQVTTGSSVWFLRPALATSGAQAVAEGYGVQYVQISTPSGIVVDTIVGTVPDLWLVQVP